MSTLAGQAGWNESRYRIAYLFHPSFVPYLPELGVCRIVYHADDSFSKMPVWTRDLEADEHSLVSRADMLIATSPGVRRNLPGSGPARAQILQNGANIELFATGSSSEVPEDLMSIPPPRIGYFGTVSPKVDLALVDTLAGLRTDWQWVFIGKCVERSIMADPPSRDAWLRMRNRSNVHFLGLRPYHDLPRYVAHMDVNTLCYRTDPGGWWTDLSPLKLHEYLTVGQPVVAASLEVLNPLRHVVAIAEGSRQWIDALSQAIYETGTGTPEQRREVATAHDWKGIVAQLDSRLISMMAS